MQASAELSWCAAGKLGQACSRQGLLEWSLHSGARWHVAWPLLLAAVTLPGEAVLYGCRLSLVARGGGSALGVVTIGRTPLWPPYWTELPFRS